MVSLPRVLHSWSCSTNSSRPRSSLVTKPLQSCASKLALVMVMALLYFNYSFLSDGIDRTGAFICLYSQLERVKVEGVADIFQFVKGSRFHRPGLVQSVVSFLSSFFVFLSVLMVVKLIFFCSTIMCFATSCFWIF